ncbi:hypothetical protein HGRIS_011356 [Hohenbuehelia grisea]|uniref:Deuterolysin n=1 Tax=Hohenbuehelia grisea TaxID=104357 RepID=A0ABR3JUZ2_9AGAR
MNVLLLFYVIIPGLVGANISSKGLSVTISGPSAVLSANDLRFNAVIKNDGEDDIKLLKYGTILDNELHTQSFIVRKEGRNVKFKGVKPQLSLPLATDEAFTVIPAHQYINLTHNIGHLFDLESYGGGNYTFEAVSSFQVARLDIRSGADVRVEAQSNTVVTLVPGEHQGITEKLGVNNGCPDAHKSRIVEASFDEAKALAFLAMAIAHEPRFFSQVYISYFKQNNFQDVRQVYEKIMFGNRDAFSQPPTATLCSGTSADSTLTRGGSMLHEASTLDAASGCPLSRALSSSISGSNADNYVCYALAGYSDLEC